MIRKNILLIFFILFLAACGKLTDHHSLSDLNIHYIDAGQGDATLFQYTDEDKPFTILYDAGDWNRNDVITYLDNQNITFIDLIIISHPHADHTGQLAQIVNTYDVGEVWLSGNTISTKTFQEGLEAVLASDADYYEPRAGDVFDLGPLTIEVLHPGNLSGKLNEDSISLRFTYGEHRFLFTGDAGKNEELEMIKQDLALEADVLQLGHHGSNTSTAPEFLEAVQPAIAIYSAGIDNSYGHPHDEVVSLVENKGIELYGTDTHGTILITTDGKEYTVETQKNVTISSTKPINQNDKSNKEIPENNCVNINHATKDELQNIIHIGPARAQDIIQNRPFQTINDLGKLSGIGPKRLTEIENEGIACLGG